MGAEQKHWDAAYILFEALSYFGYGQHIGCDGAVLRERMI